MWLPTCRKRGYVGNHYHRYLPHGLMRRPLTVEGVTSLRMESSLHHYSSTYRKFFQRSLSHLVFASPLNAGDYHQWHSFFDCNVGDTVEGIWSTAFFWRWHRYYCQVSLDYPNQYLLDELSCRRGQHSNLLEPLNGDAWRGKCLAVN